MDISAGKDIITNRPFGTTDYVIASVSVVTGGGVVKGLGKIAKVSDITSDINKVEKIAIPRIGSKTGYVFKPAIDLDYRGTGKSHVDALEEAFRRTGVPRDQFTITRWATDKNGKSFPVKWYATGGAEISIDIGHTKADTQIHLISRILDIKLRGKRHLEVTL